ncbi:hypothetical protein QBC37DRAFT_321800 [Rhypophila decipiens]|uniref:Uncharacterized protein n=1 Tax=Rhypophila decipiens TaxID=261697 RepID=A0AAN7B779_9PEZI|nr:hypothetical protein QBC37DRAFT_321800 [Rhypophila decipiens]
MDTPYFVWDDRIPSCDVLDKLVYFYPRVDVSGVKTGVRCENKDTSMHLDCSWTGDPSDIDVIEMNFHSTNPIWHWNYNSPPATYKNVGYPLVGLDDSVWGTCRPQTLPQPKFECEHVYGYRIFHCVDDQPGRTLPSAAEINGLRRS